MIDQLAGGCRRPEERVQLSTQRKYMNGSASGGFFVGWGTLSLINAGLAVTTRKS
jgi:hypothetical protein